MCDEVKSNIRQVKQLQVLEVRSLIGAGVPGNPVRELVEYFSLDGERLAQRNTFTEPRVTVDDD
jgi:hypothetical protein